MPPLFPIVIMLNVKIDLARQELRPWDVPIKPDARGLCSIRFDKGGLVLRSPR